MSDEKPPGLTKRGFVVSGAAIAAGGIAITQLVTNAAAQAPARGALPVVAPSAPVMTRTDFVYGRVEGSALLANLAYPDAAGPRPAIISIHGGRWRAGDRTDAGTLKVADWAAAGFFAMSIDYRLVGGSPAPAAYLDTQCAIRWLHAHADDYGIDPERVYLIGPSAGGHLVSLVATLGAGQYPKVGGWENARSDVRAVVSVSGAYDLPTLSWGNLWTPVSGDVEEARRMASPMNHISAATKPILVIHSDDDQSVPIKQALDFVAKLQAANAPHRFVHYKDKGHMGMIDDVLREAHAFIAEQEAKKA